MRLCVTDHIRPQQQQLKREKDHWGQSFKNMSADYGAVDQVIEGDTGFDVGETYYVKEKPLTNAEKNRKCLACALPLVIGVLLLAGFIMYLLHDFGQLYPSPNGNYPRPAVIITPPTTTIIPPSPSPVTPPPPPPLPSAPSAACVNHIKCSNLNLTGMCCPTNENVTLGCCF